MKMFRRKDEGFTLVELMVVVLIIGILVAIAIPVFNNASAAARTRTCQANQRTIEGSVQQYLAANPTATWAGGSVNSGSVLVAGQYLKTAPTCPRANENYSTDTSGTVTDDGNPLTARGTAATDTTHPHF